MYLSKIFNLRHTEILDAFAECTARPWSEMFLNVGFPLLRPPRIRGSMLAFLKFETLIRNEASLTWGSLFDSGGIAFGYFGTTECAMAERCRIGGEQFLELMSAISRLHEEDRHKFAKQIPSQPVIDLAAEYFGTDLASRLVPDEYSGLLHCEVCLSGPIVVHATDLIELHCPNTYRALPALKRLRGRMDEKLRYYNPQFGIESVKVDAIRLDRYL